MAVDNAHLRELVALVSQSVESVLAQYAAAARPVPSLDSTDPSAPLDNRAIREATRVLESACAQLCASVAPPNHILVNMVNPACLRVALTARVAEQLRDGPKPISELAKTSGISADKLGRILRNLATKHCFREVSKDVWANNRLSVCLLPEDTTSGLIGHMTDEMYFGMTSLTDALTDAEWTDSTDKEHAAFTRAHKHNVFEIMTNDAKRGERFPQAMLGWTKLHGGAEVVVQLYPWDSVPANATFCDVGGSVGHVAMALTKAKPHIKAVVQDLPTVVEQAKDVWQKEFPEAVQKQRVQFVPIDFFAGSPVEGCDFYYSRSNTCQYLTSHRHDWPDADCETILKNTRKAMKPGSKVLIHEFILMHAAPEAVSESSEKAPFPLLPNFGVGAQRKYNQDLNMMSAFNSRERTLDDFVAIGAKAGLKLVKTWEAADTTIVELEAAHRRRIAQHTCLLAKRKRFGDLGDGRKKQHELTARRIRRHLEL
ncbi:S-adenosyl-L-methionine-dependent methyltransferase [Exidia glandulosa HHB12029]|uniref:S-adenosyl-L-methionine-dependent methyltransferase n=1 Tax=Exidia glandulosa HHB12029 TaxID=1314781 RepID=A0A165P4P5_EXIGL|nr:S-adenosyl-L-methionine-dependent methyltransferase [Exidia glandulosa HHB12029]